MKKILLFIGLILFGLANAQNELSKCKFNYELELEKKIENKQKNIYNAVFKWDFSKLNSNTNISLEIVPIKDCMTDIYSQNNKETVILSNTDEKFKLKDTWEFGIADLQTKCFKWRLIISDKNISCKEITEWQFVTFTNN